MKYFIASNTLALLLFRAVTGVAAADGDFTIEATLNGVRVNAADILVPYEPNVDVLNRNIQVAGNPPSPLPANLPDLPAPPTGLLAGFPPRRQPRSNPLEKRTTYYVSRNWCGAIGKPTNSSNPVQYVTGWFQVPTLSARPGQAFPQTLAAWIGIDGVTYRNALLQAGITAQLSSSGVQTNYAWFEWVPQAANTISGFQVRAGDWINVNVSARTNTNGEVYIYNQNTGNVADLVLNNGPTLGRIDTEWIVEDPSSNNSPVPFPTFTRTWFEDTAAKLQDKSNVGLLTAALSQLSNGTANVCSPYVYNDANFYAQSS